MYNAFGAAKLQTFFSDRLLQGLVFWGNVALTWDHGAIIMPVIGSGKIPACKKIMKPMQMGVRKEAKNDGSISLRR